MSTSALLSEGIVFAYEDTATSPVDYVAVPEVTDLQGPGGTTTTIEASDLSSTFRQKKAGLTDAGELTLTINYIADNAVHMALRALWVSSAQNSYRISYTDTGATTDTFTGFISQFRVANSVDGLTTAALTIVIDSAITTA